MRTAHRSFAVAIAAGLVLLLGACANNSLDSGSGPNVILSISQFPIIPPVTSTYNAALGACVFTAPPPISVTLRNSPKSTLASAGPFTDVTIDSAVVTYAWDDNLLVGPIVESTSGLIPANATQTVPFTPILLGVLTSDRGGHTVSLEITFRGRTVDGTRIESLPDIPGGATVSVNSCIPPAK
jgi:hypothetical protein